VSTTHRGHADRYIALDGCYNFRDLGGYRAGDGRIVRSGQLFRSDALHHLGEADVELLRNKLGVRAIIDVRSAAEVAAERTSALARPPVAYHHMPLFRNDTPGRADEEVPADLGDVYFMILQEAAQPIREVFEMLARLPVPTVFHCAAGKDRTGMIAALLLSLLGVCEEDVVEDYAATSRNLDQIIERLTRSEGYGAIFRELPPHTLHAEPRTMESLLAQLRHFHGSARGYLREIGVSDASLLQLEERLLERA
jgi:protein-tyrosine phosphatase